MNIFITSKQTAAKFLAVFALFSLLAGMMPMQTFAAVNDHQVTICHATGGSNYSAANPNKAQIFADANSSSANAHGSFQIGVHPDDVIPPFSAGSQGNNSWGDYAGKNWDAAGIDIYNNGACNGDGIPNILGCTDPAANNYNSAANQNDGSCTYDVLGCTNITADNYNPAATVDNGSCTFTIPGCTDSAANNYNPAATTDNGSCTYDPTDIPGCTDSAANNYNPAATTDNGSCTYDPVPGCTDSTATNFNPAATQNDGSCTYIVPGCTDVLANNYNPAATTDNGSCTYDPVPQLCTVEIVSDATAYVVERDAAAVATYVHPTAWTASIPGATWIWADALVQAPTTVETYTFQNNFGFIGTVTSASLEVATDNGHTATLNNGTANTFGSSFNNKQTYNVTTDITQGNNTLEVEVTNAAGNANPQSNPAGALYKLTIQGEVTSDADCSVAYVPPVPESCTDGIQNQNETGIDTGGICGNGGGGGPASVCSIGDNLLLNGSFEEPAISGSWSLSTITNWVVTKVSNSTSTLGELWRGFGVGPSDGEQNVELAAAESTQLTQSVTTVAGATYELRFDFAARGTNVADNNIDALVDGNVLRNVNTGVTDWTTYSDTFVAASTSTDIAFRDADVSNNSTGSLLDNAVLCYVSGPVIEDVDTYVIFGYVWHDNNRNTDWDNRTENGENPLAGWTVTITNGSTSATTTTDSEGYYEFEVPAGTWTITETVESGWEQTTQASHVVTVPEVQQVSLLNSVMNFIIPTAHAAVVDSIGEFNFGNDETRGGGGGGLATPVNRGGGGGGATRGSVLGATDDATLEPLVLGEQVSAVPTGAPDTGKGGTAQGTVLGQFLALPRRKVS